MAALLGCTAVGAHACVGEWAHSVSAAVVRESQQWDEFSSNGKRLLRESGQLSGPALIIGTECDRWRLNVGLELLDGSRNYDGQTNLGTPLQTQSRISSSKGHGEVSFAVTPNWRLGARWSGVSTERDIASTPTATGYPEYYEWRLWQAGAAWSTEMDWGGWGAGLWWGRTSDSAMRVQLPGRDPAWLELGTIEQSQFDLHWRYRMGGRWMARVAWAYRQTEVAQGAPGVIRNNGVPVSTAYQPRIALTEMPLSVRIQREF